MARTKRSTNQEALAPKSRKEIILDLIKKKDKNGFLNEKQKEYYDNLRSHEITICYGPAGSGKSYIGVKCALDLISDPNSPYDKIIITRSAVESSDSKLGLLPGTFEEKMMPYVYPSYHIIDKILGKETRLKLKENNIIEILPISYMRGMTIDNAIVLLEETQNCTPNEVKMFLTRIGSNSKFFISGDIEQSDKYKNKVKSGLFDIIHRLDDIDEICIYKFSNSDIVRNKIITKILERYE